MPKPVASVSLDLDNQWSYMKTHGDKGWEEFPSYLDLVVPRILKFLEQRSTRITFFIVGQDAALEKNRQALAAIAEAGHEIANHSFHHEPWLHLYNPARLEEEFETSEEAIFNATGQRPVGFRGPGFSLSDQVLQMLHRRGYQYDCSTFPTYLGPLARMYYFMTAGFSRDEKAQRKQLFGSFSDGFQPLKPFEWKLGTKRLLEIPVTTMPLFKTPLHMSYLAYLGTFSMWAAKTYFWKAMVSCKLFGVAPSFLLHPLDFLGDEDHTGLEYFPGMRMSAEKKLELLGFVFDAMEKRFRVDCMKEHAESVRDNKLKERSIQFAPVGVS